MDSPPGHKQCACGAGGVKLLPPHRHTNFKLVGFEFAQAKECAGFRRGDNSVRGIAALP